MAGHLLELSETGLRRRQLDELDFVELVLADEAAHVLAVGARLAAETGRVGRVAQRQEALVQDLFAVEIGERHLGRRHEVVVGAFEMEQVGLELRQLAGADQAVAIDDERRQHLAVAVSGGVQVEHEGDESALEARVLHAETAAYHGEPNIAHGDAQADALSALLAVRRYTAHQERERAESERVGRLLDVRG